ncbi:MAG: 4-hydroxythreonine-4-phosphate dehydrogenase PdxA [Betaproteobacteria bacterium]|nr:4-hydroxythreonine-4-phosphate dehydrogenase PdxA [Betaproteobacteria bacterium]
MRALPVIAVTSGEPAGIGPELCLQLAQQNFPARLVVLADRFLLAERASTIGVAGLLRDYVPADADANEPGVEVLHLPLANPSQPGKLDVGNATYVLSLLDRALSGCQRGEFAAMVTAPVHKAVINQSGKAFSGHTEYLAEHTDTPLVVMMLAGETVQGPLRVALATTHLPLRAVADAITPELLEAILRILHADMARKFGIASPRILVAGLNPHAGEDGYLGREEIDVMAPVLDRLRAEGMNLIGPLPADTLFTPPQLARGDCVLAMYHDQGLATLKYATFGKGINVTLGLPIIRTSVDHGTALSLAGTGQADPGSLFEAVRQAIHMVEASRSAA